jgi:hypothetical protein
MIEGDVAIILADDDGDKSNYIYDGSVWIRLYTNYTLDSMTDVVLTGTAHNDIVKYNSGTSRWENIPGPNLTQWINYLNTMNQNVSSTSAPTFPFIIFNDHLRLVSVVAPSFPAIGTAAIAFVSGVVTVKDNAGTFSLRAIETDAFHTNRAFLDAINQNLAITANASFNRVSIADRVNMINNLVATIGVGQFQFWNFEFVFEDSVGQINLRTLQTNTHTHANISNLNSINQDLATTSNIVANSITLTLKVIMTNILSVTSAQGQFYYLNNDFVFHDSIGTISLRGLAGSGHTHTNLAFLNLIDQSLAIAANPTFNSTTFTNMLRISLGVPTWPNGSTTGGMAYESPGNFTFSDVIGVINLRTLQTNSHIHANITQLDLINQSLATTANPNFNTINLALRANFTNINSITWAQGDVAYFNNEFTFSDSIGLINLRTVATNANHTNLSFLNTINQNMGTSHAPTFAGLTTNNYIWLNQSVPNYAAGNIAGTIAYEAGNVIIADIIGVINLRTLATNANHTNLSFLNTINQNMATTNDVVFNKIKVANVTANASNVVDIADSGGINGYFRFDMTALRLRFMATPLTSHIQHSNSDSSITIGYSNPGGSANTIRFETATSTTRFLGAASFPVNSDLIFEQNNRIFCNSGFVICKLPPTNSGVFVFTNTSDVAVGAFYNSRVTNIHSLKLGVSGDTTLTSDSLTNFGTQLSTSSTLWTLVSDSRTKQNITNLDCSSGLCASFKLLHFVRYDYVYKQGKMRSGLLAQEVKLIPRYIDCVSIKTEETSLNMEDNINGPVDPLIIADLHTLDNSDIMMDCFAITQEQIFKIEALEALTTVQATTITTQATTITAQATTITSMLSRLEAIEAILAAM